MGAVTRDSSAFEDSKIIQRSLSSAFEEAGGKSIIANVEPTPNIPAVDELEDTISEARGQFLHGDFKSSLSLTNKGIERFEDTAAATDNERLWELYVEMLLVKALAEGRLRKDSKRTLRKLAALRPDYEPDPSLTPPDIMSDFKKAQAQAKDASQTLGIKSEPSGVEVFIDGISRGRTPLNIELPKGPHFISARGQRVASQAVNLVKDDLLLLATGSQGGDEGALLTQILGEGASVKTLGAEADKIGEDVFVALIRDQGNSFGVFLGRFRDLELISISALDLNADLADVDEATRVLVRNAIENDGGDRYILGGKDGAPVRSLFLGSSQEDGFLEPVDGEGASLLWPLVGGAAITTVAAVIVVTALVVYSAPSNEGRINIRVENNL